MTSGPHLSYSSSSPTILFLSLLSLSLARTGGGSPREGRPARGEARAGSSPAEAALVPAETRPKRSSRAQMRRPTPATEAPAGGGPLEASSAQPRRRSSGRATARRRAATPTGRAMARRRRAAAPTGRGGGLGAAALRSPDGRGAEEELAAEQDVVLVRMKGQNGHFTRLVPTCQSSKSVNF